MSKCYRDLNNNIVLLDPDYDYKEHSIYFWECPRCNKISICEDANFCSNCGATVLWADKEWK